VPALYWTRLDTAEREAKTWREWRDAFRGRFEELRAETADKLQKALAC